MKTILVPYDFSKEAMYALEFAKELAKKTKNKLELFHVIELPTPQSFSSYGEAGTFSAEANQVYTVELIEKRKKQLAELSESLQNLGFIFESKMVFGNPFAGIAREIAEAEADLVIMGSKGASGLEEVLIGSNTEKVVRHASCPVITIKGPFHLKELKKVVFASDFKNVPSDVVARLKELLKVFQAELHLVKINTPSMFEASRVSKNNMESFQSDTGLDVASMEIYNSVSEEEGILDYAEDIDADIIAMATHGRTGFLHLLSGSIAEDVVNAAHRPVWTMKSKK